jgi:hypothetical protein
MPEKEQAPNRPRWFASGSQGKERSLFDLFKKSGTSLRLMAALALVSVFVVGLAGGALAQSDSMAKVRVIHASPDAPAVDVYVDGEVAVEGLEFQSGTDYLDLAAGDHQFQVVPAGGDPADAVIDANATVEAGTWYSVVAVGLVAEIEPLIVVDNITEPAEGQAHIKVVHASPDAPAVDIAVAGGPVLFENAEFGAATEYLPVDAGTYDLEVRPAGTEDVALEVPGLALEAGTVYSAYAMGLLEDGSLTVVPFVDSTFEQDGGDGGEATETPGAAEPTATSGDAAQPTATEGATGGGDVPTMPDTGAGGTADGSDSTLLYILAATSVLLLAAGGGFFAWSRRSA